MALNKEQRKKLSDVAEKLGVTVLIASVGDAIVNIPTIPRMGLDIIGSILGMILLAASIRILKGEN